MPKNVTEVAREIISVLEQRYEEGTCVSINKQELREVSDRNTIRKGFMDEVVAEINANSDFHASIDQDNNSIIVCPSMPVESFSDVKNEIEEEN